MGGTKTKRTRYGVLILITLILLGTGYYGIFVEPYDIDVRHVWIDDSGLGEILKGKVIVHLSDLHIGKIGKRERRVLEILDELQPDLIFLTGDYVSWKGVVEPALQFLSHLKAKIGVWAVMGDYDYSYSRKSCLFCHEQGSGKPSQQHQVRFLRNTLEKVNLQGESFWIGGMDLEGERPFVSKNRFQAWQRKEPTIILSHNPLNFELLADDHDVLILSGDTHGGQVPLPSWLWDILGYEKNAKYNQGLYVQDKKKMFVTRGVGTSHVPVRVLRPPEVAVLHFK